MKDNFILRFEDGMPKGTAQQKRYNGYTRTYFPNKNLQRTQLLFKTALTRHRPPKPSEGPVRLFIVFYFDKKQPKKLWGKFKTTRPDVENYAKEFIDQMTKSGFWIDDSQIVDLRLKKYYAEKASIYVEWEELNDE